MAEAEAMTSLEPNRQQESTAHKFISKRLMAGSESQSLLKDCRTGGYKELRHWPGSECIIVKNSPSLVNESSGKL